MGNCMRTKGAEDRLTYSHEDGSYGTFGGSVAKVVTAEVLNPKASDADAKVVYEEAERSSERPSSASTLGSFGDRPVEHPTPTSAASIKVEVPQPPTFFVAASKRGGKTGLKARRYLKFTDSLLAVHKKANGSDMATVYVRAKRAQNKGGGWLHAGGGKR